MPNAPELPKRSHIPSQREIARVGRLLRTEFVGGALLVAAALLGFLAANSPLADFFF